MVSWRPPPIGLHLGIELVDQRGERQGAPFARASSSARPRSLRIQSTAKPKSILAFDHRRPAVDHLPALRRAPRDGVEHFGRVEARRHGEMDRLGEPFDALRRCDLVDHLGELAAARRADMDGRAA